MGKWIVCEYPLCELADKHTLLTCPIILAWRQKCERRGNLPVHHEENDMVQLEEMFLAHELFNWFTGFKLLAPAKG